MNAVDVAVIGGGPAGIAAAVAAARLGARTTLVERHDVLGGMGTAGLVNNFCPAHLDGTRLIIGGIFAEIRQRLADRKAIYLSPGFAYNFEAYHPGVMNEVCCALCVESGVTVLTGRRLVHATFPAGGDAVLELDDGRMLSARAVVDATGDAVVAAGVGVPLHHRDGAQQPLMPLTYCYKIGPVDLPALAAARPRVVRQDELTGEPVVIISGLKPEVAAARRAGDLRLIPIEGVSAVLNIPGEPMNVTVNFGRVVVEDPTDPVQLAEAEKIGRAQVEEGVRFFRKYVPGFARVELLELARQIGVRESRQIRGLYTLTGADVLGCRQFDDVIAQCCYAMDVHEANGGGTRLVELPRGRHFDIPWRCLVPVSGPPNLVVAGRCISATQEAMSSFRVSPSVMAIGEAAGVGAALAVQARQPIARVAATAVQARLRATGGILE